MDSETMITWLREEAKFSIYRSEEELFNLIADRIESLEDYITSIRGTVVKGEPIGTIKALQADNALKIPREPTQAMLKAGDLAWSEGTLTLAIWQAMYDAALQETGHDRHKRIGKAR